MSFVKQVSGSINRSIVSIEWKDLIVLETIKCVVEKQQGTKDTHILVMEGCKH